MIQLKRFSSNRNTNINFLARQRHIKKCYGRSCCQKSNGETSNGISDDTPDIADNEGIVLEVQEEKTEGYVPFTEIVAVVLPSPSI